jgi:predicted MFS family arabinose efflux permease
MDMKKATDWDLEKSKEVFRMTKRKIWIILFIIGIVMILGASEFSRFLANEISWYTAGIILSIVSGLGLLFEMYFRRNK